MSSFSCSFSSTASGTSFSSCSSSFSSSENCETTSSSSSSFPSSSALSPTSVSTHLLMPLSGTPSESDNGLVGHFDAPFPGPLVTGAAHLAWVDDDESDLLTPPPNEEVLESDIEPDDPPPELALVWWYEMDERRFSPLSFPWEGLNPIEDRLLMETPEMPPPLEKEPALETLHLAPPRAGDVAV